MITIIFGEPGAGKTSFCTYLIKDLYRKQGARLLKECRKAVAKENERRKYPLALPSAPPIFSDYEVKFSVGYKKTYLPYFINGFYFGLENENMPVQYLLPGSKIFLTEGQRYFDSRRSGTFPRWVSEAFEMHRHYGLDIYIDVQRAKLIDLNIRELAHRFIEVLRMENEANEYGRISGSTFYCREFGSNAEVENYLSTGLGGKDLEPFFNRGNIYKCFDSRSHAKDFYPKDRPGKEFTLLKFLGEGEQVRKDLECYYRTGEPKEYRLQPGKKEGKKDERVVS